MLGEFFIKLNSGSVAMKRSQERTAQLKNKKNGLYFKFQLLFEGKGRSCQQRGSSPRRTPSVSRKLPLTLTMKVGGSAHADAADRGHISQDFEMPAIFTLADQLRAMSGNDFYDIAERLFSVWKEEQETEIKDTLRKIVIIYHRKSLLLKSRFFHHFHKSVLREPPARVGPPSSFHDSEYYFSPQQMRHSASISGSSPSHFLINPYDNVTIRPKDPYAFPPPMIGKPKNQEVFERLYNEASTKEELRELRKELRQHRELNKCTFHPKTNRSAGSSRSALNRSSSCASSQAMTARGPLGLNSPATVSRLAKDDRKVREQIYRKQKEERELRECTFAPKINTSSSRMELPSAH